MTVVQTPSLGVLHIKSQIEALGEVLPKFIRALKSDEVQNHKVWGYALPFDVTPYGNGASLGHCVRPDIIVTNSGQIKVCELDFVPSGRGFLLSALNDHDSDTYLDAYKKWYASMGVDHVQYGVATKTTCMEEIKYFAKALARHGVDIEAVNLDTCQLSGLIDRLSYRSEMTPDHPSKYNLDGVPVITAEPYLDSKAVFALVHDTDMDSVLLQYMSKDELAFLRNVLAETYLIRYPVTGEILDAKYLLPIIDNPKDWAIKNANVETDYNWGARGVMLGKKYSRRAFVNALMGHEPRRKDFGKNPVVQRFAESRDFTGMWNSVIRGYQAQAHVSTFARAQQAHMQEARKKVYARVGVYYLISTVTDEVFMPPYAIVTLRQDPLAHGASDVIFTAASLAYKGA